MQRCTCMEKGCVCVCVPPVRRSSVKRLLSHLYRSVLPGLCLPSGQLSGFYYHTWSNLGPSPGLPMHPWAKMDLEVKASGRRLVDSEFRPWSPPISSLSKCKEEPMLAVLSCSVVLDTLWSQELWPPGPSVQGDSPGKNTGVGCHASTSRGSSQSMDHTQVSTTEGRYYTIWATREAEEEPGWL